MLELAMEAVAILEEEEVMTLAVVTSKVEEEE